MTDTTQQEDVKKKKRRRRKKKVLPVEPVIATEVSKETKNISSSDISLSGEQKESGQVNQENFPVDVSHIPAANNPLGIDDIASYIQSMKQKSGNPVPTVIPGELTAFDGTDLRLLPNLYAIVPHAKGNHKLVYKREQAPEDLRDDDKARTKGSQYIKQGRLIYDVFVDFKRHPVLKAKDGSHMDAWIIDDPQDLEQQLTSIQKSEGGGIHFGNPVVLEKNIAPVVPVSEALENPDAEAAAIDPNIVQETNQETIGGEALELISTDTPTPVMENDTEHLPGFLEETEASSYNDESTGEEVEQVSESPREQQAVEEATSIPMEDPNPYQVGDGYGNEEVTVQNDRVEAKILPTVSEELTQEEKVGTEDFTLPEITNTDDLIIPDIETPDIIEAEIDGAQEVLDSNDLTPLITDINDQHTFDTMETQAYESPQKVEEEVLPGDDQLPGEALQDSVGEEQQEQQQNNDAFWNTAPSSEEGPTILEPESEQGEEKDGEEQSVPVELVTDTVIHEDEPLQVTSVTPELGIVSIGEPGVTVIPEQPLLQAPTIDISDIVLEAPEESGVSTGSTQEGVLDTFKVGVDSVFHTHLHEEMPQSEPQVSSDTLGGEKKETATLTAGLVSETSMQQLQALTSSSVGNSTNIKEQASKKSKKILLLIAEILLPLLLIGLAYGVYKIMFSATDIDPIQQEQIQEGVGNENSGTGKENTAEVVIPSIEKQNEQQKTTTGANEEITQNSGSTADELPSNGLGSQYTSEELASLLRQYIKETEGLLSQSTYNSHAGAEKILRIAQQKSSFMLHKLETTGETPSLEEVEQAIKRIETYIKQAKDAVLSNDSL